MNNLIDYDFIICVYGCITIEKYKQQLLKMKDTIGKTILNYKNCKILYFLGENKVLDEENFIYLHGVKDDYLSATYKQWHGLKYIHENYKSKFTIFIGTDTYVNIYKCLDLIKNYNHNDNLYIGGHGDIRKILGNDIYFHSGGPGFILSYGAMQKVYPIIYDVNNFVDKWRDICIKSNQYNLIPACDVAIAYIVSLPHVNSHIIKINGFYHCNYLGYPCHPNQFKYHEIYSCHLMSLYDFDKFTEILKNIYK